MKKNIKVLEYGGDMYVIAVYDISTMESAGRRRIVKVMKTMRQYLHHTQKSVFEGEITDAKLFALKKLINGIINDNEDYVVFFKIPNINNIERENMGIEFNPTNTII